MDQSKNNPADLYDFPETFEEEMERIAMSIPVDPIWARLRHEAAQSPTTLPRAPDPTRPVPTQPAQEQTAKKTLLGLPGSSISHQELKSLPIPETQWLIDTMIPYPGLVAISGRPGSYKTFFALWIAQRINAQKKLFDTEHSKDGYTDLHHESVGCKVLFVEEEMVERQMHDRSLKMSAWTGHGVHYLIGKGFKITSPIHRQELMDHCEKEQVKCIVFDPFSSIAGLQDENDNAEASKVMDLLRNCFVARGVTVIFVHHPAKSDDTGWTLRGAGDVTGKVDEHFVLEKDEKIKNEVIVRFAKTRDIDPMKVHDFRMQFGETKNGLAFEYLRREEDTTGDREQDAMDSAAREIVTKFGDELSVEELAKKVKELRRDAPAKNAVERALKKRPTVPDQIYSPAPPVDPMN